MNLNEMRGQIKKDLINKYDYIKSEIEICGEIMIQKLQKSDTLEQKNKEQKISEIAKKTSKLIEKINGCFDSSMQDVNHYFDDLDKNNNYADIKTKEQLMKEIIKHDLLYIKQEITRNQKSIQKFAYGFLIQFDFYFSENDMKFLR
jgi:hypothetical protein